MLDTLTINDAINVVTAGRQVLGSRIVRGNRLKSLTLDPQLSPNIFAEVRAILSSQDSKLALSSAIRAGNGIVGALTSLSSSASLAGRQSLVSSLTNLRMNDTRISRLNLHVDTNRSLFLIDGLVKNAEFKNANFISSSSPNIRISTTQFGGAIDITPQPLDTRGLSLTNVSLMTINDANNSKARIETAINTATRRLNGLETLQRAITSGDYSSQILTSLVIRLQADAIPSGTLVNVVA